jgi:hypothetical protein
MEIDTLEKERQEMIRAETEEPKDPFVPAKLAEPTAPEDVLVKVVL